MVSVVETSAFTFNATHLPFAYYSRFAYFVSGGNTTAGIWPVGAMAASGLCANCTNCGCTVVVDAKSSTVGFGVAFIGVGTGCAAGVGCWVAATTVGSTLKTCEVSACPC